MNAYLVAAEILVITVPAIIAGAIAWGMMRARVNNMADEFKGLELELEKREREFDQHVRDNAQAMERLRETEVTTGRQQVEIDRLMEDMKRRNGRDK